MDRNRTPTSTICVLLGLCIALAGVVVPAPVRGQYPYQCPPGYYYDPYYGCVLQGYVYAPPYYVYPDYGFTFFYGGGGWGGYYGRGGGVAPRGGAPHGAAPHGGGSHGGGHGGH
jgi:hypothetical protein